MNFFKLITQNQRVEGKYFDTGFESKMADIHINNAYELEPMVKYYCPCFSKKMQGLGNFSGSELIPIFKFHSTKSNIRQSISQVDRVCEDILIAGRGNRLALEILTLVRESFDEYMYKPTFEVLLFYKYKTAFLFELVEICSNNSTEGDIFRFLLQNRFVFEQLLPFRNFLMDLDTILLAAAPHTMAFPLILIFTFQLCASWLFFNYFPLVGLNVQLLQKISLFFYLTYIFLIRVIHLDFNILIFDDG